MANQQLRSLESFWCSADPANIPGVSSRAVLSENTCETDFSFDQRIVGSTSTGGSSGYDVDRESDDDSEIEGTDTTSTASRESHESGPPRKKRKASKLSFKEEWKVRYLMISIPNSEEMVCIQCEEKMKAKTSTASRHISHKHPTTSSFSQEKRKRLLNLYENQKKSQHAILQSAFTSDELTVLAPYKLAFLLGKHKMPFSSCSVFVNFAKCADPKSVVFQRMPASRDTITKRTQDIYRQVLKPAVIQGVNSSPYWSLIADESTDTSTQEQLSLFVRYINLNNKRIVEEFLELKRIVGHPTAANLFTAVMECIRQENVQNSLPADKLVGLTTDGASVMVSERGGLYGKLKQAVNPKLFLTHCPPHRLILASKSGQKILPGDIEKTVSDVLFFFKDSSVRRDQFHSLK